MSSHRPVLLALLVALSLLVGCGGDEAQPSDPCKPRATPVTTPAIHTPRWAFEPWASKDISDSADTRAFVAGFSEHDIPVGVVVLDSPWETQYNTFVPNPSRYPGFAELVSELHDRGVRIVLWITQMVNTSSLDFEPGGDTYSGPSPNFEEGERCGFFIEEGEEFAWWKGKGAALDFFNPYAVAWWHAQQDPLFKLGVDGFKVDFADEYIKLDTVSTADGAKSKQDYSEAYYRDFFAYGVQRRGRDDFVTMVRPYDQSYGFPGRFYARKEHAPVAWVGDNRRDFVGVSDALDHLFRSAAAGYAVIGSDIGGYLDRDDNNLLGEIIPFDQNVFVRWTALGALTPFMQLHGRANITPWTVPEKVEETIAIYRYWATLHHELVPFFYSLAEETYAGGPPILRPIGLESEWPGDYRFALGDALLVAPLLDATGVRDVALPTGARWFDWWAPAAPGIDGGQTLAAYDAQDQQRIPLFVREGAIVPMNVASDVTGFGTPASAGHTTLLVYPAAFSSTFVMHDEDDEKTTITATSDRLELSRLTRPFILRVRRDASPASVVVDEQPLAAYADRAGFDAAPTGYFYDSANRFLWVKIEQRDAGATVRWL